MKKVFWNVYGLLQSVCRRDEGQGMVEYGLIIAGIAVVVAAVFVVFSGDLKGVFTSVETSL